MQLPKTALGYLFSNKELVNYLLAFNKLRSSKDKNIKDFLKNAEPFLIKKFQKENEYLQILYSKHTCLLKLILLRFSKLCATKGYIPHLIMLPSFSHIKFMQAGNSLYKNVLPAICTEINLNYIDMFKFWDLPNCDDLEKYFVDVYGHCSALGNQKVANIIYKEILS